MVLDSHEILFNDLLFNIYLLFKSDNFTFFYTRINKKKCNSVHRSLLQKYNHKPDEIRCRTIYLLKTLSTNSRDLEMRRSSSRKAVRCLNRTTTIKSRKDLKKEQMIFEAVFEACVDRISIVLVQHARYSHVNVASASFRGQHYF